MKGGAGACRGAGWAGWARQSAALLPCCSGRSWRRRKLGAWQPPLTATQAAVTNDNRRASPPCSATMVAVWFMTWPRTAALLVALLWLAIALLMLLGTGAAGGRAPRRSRGRLRAAAGRACRAAAGPRRPVGTDRGVAQGAAAMHAHPSLPPSLRATARPAEWRLHGVQRRLPVCVAGWRPAWRTRSRAARDGAAAARRGAAQGCTRPPAEAAGTQQARSHPLFRCTPVTRSADAETFVIDYAKRRVENTQYGGAVVGMIKYYTNRTEPGAGAAVSLPAAGCRLPAPLPADGLPPAPRARAACGAPAHLPAPARLRPASHAPGPVPLPAHHQQLCGRGRQQLNH